MGVSIRQVVAGPEGERYELAATPVDVRAAEAFTVDWEISVDDGTVSRIFRTSDPDVAQRLVVQLGEQLRAGALS